MVQACRRRPAVRHAAEIRTRAETAAPGVLCFARARAGKGRIFPARPTSAKPCRSTCAIFSPAWQPTQQDIQTLHGVIMAIAEGRKGPGARRRARRRGSRDAACASRRARLRPRAEGARTGARSGAAACAAIRPMPSGRCGRRSSTTGALPGAALSARRRSARHICDFVSFPLRLVIDLVPADENAAAAAARAQKSALARKPIIIRSLRIFAGEVESDMAAALDRIERGHRSISDQSLLSGKHIE